MPRDIKTGRTSLVLGANFSIVTQLEDAPSDLKDAISRTLSYLNNDQLGRLIVGRGALDQPLLSGAHRLTSLCLSLVGPDRPQSIATEAVLPPEKRREEYSLSIPSDGSAATLIANSTLGLFRGLTTFEQLWYSTGDSTYTLEAPISIEDAPAFVRTFCWPYTT